MRKPLQGILIGACSEKNTQINNPNHMSRHDNLFPVVAIVGVVPFFLRAPSSS